MDFRPMSPEEIQRTMQFLLNQQAQFAADFARLVARTDTMSEAIIGLTGIVGRVADGLEKVTGGLGKVAEGLTRLTDAQLRTEEHLRDTDARLDVVIQMFERHLREDHGARPS